MIRTTMAAAAAALAAAQGADMKAWRTPLLPMQFAAVSALGVPWGAAGTAQVVAPYRNRGSVSLRVTLGRDGATMCSATAPARVDTWTAPAPPTNIMATS